MSNITRAGVYTKQPKGFHAFIPKPLPPNPPIRMDEQLIRLQSDADLSLGRLDGVATILPNPDLFVRMYVRHEAVLSSQIEGTNTTLGELLAFEASGKILGRRHDVLEVRNYVTAMNHGLQRLKELPLSLRLLREIHEKLLYGVVRGADRHPGEFRTIQNWIGGEGVSIDQAEFVPPPPHHLPGALKDFETFLHDRELFPPLIHCGLAHAQFETIHPFNDGNGRVGRLLITLLLCEREILQRPLLYLSYYFKAHRREYYDRLMAIRHDGDWEGWLKFFLKGVCEVSRAASKIAREILELRKQHRELITRNLSSVTNAVRLLDRLYQEPVVWPTSARQFLGCSYSTANNILRALQELGIVEEITGQYRNRVFRYSTYIRLFDQQALQIADQETPESA